MVEVSMMMVMVLDGGGVYDDNGSGDDSDNIDVVDNNGK